MANVGQLPHAKRNKNKLEICTPVLLIFSVLELKSHGCLEKEGILVRLTIWIIPFISRFHYIGAPSAGFDLEPAVQQKFRGQFPEKYWIERG